MAAFYSTKKSRVRGLQPYLGVLEYPLSSSASLVLVLKVHPSLSPLSGEKQPARKEIKSISAGSGEMISLDPPPYRILKTQTWQTEKTSFLREPQTRQKPKQ